MINELNAKKFCRDDISLIENYAEALADTTQMWLCHHRNGEPFTGFSRADLKKMKMYYNRPASELKFVTRAEHNHIHKKGKEPWNKGKRLSDETKLKLSAAKLGKKRKPFSEEAKANMSAARKGKKLSVETKAKSRDKLCQH